MLDHISFSVKNYEESLSFYDKTLALLGYTREITLDFPGVKAAGYGNGGVRPVLWIGAGGREDEAVGSAQGLHIAFKAPSVEAVDKWYQTCLQLGATDNGAPGPRAHYHPGYYGAFVVDPNGWRIETCFHHYQP
jgi:catechol 2,3-dioxygenase-like lactoylglutathione lyase family enzyme